ncbi:restriction endonuclease subunit S [Sporosarcina sp. Marseille-Q4063]|uniref:restriction endonuclease subunit S n=1 Tax=Sporosarcina sp. Marseille-Q4063 TaxID=2810514 RepID=UPI001BAE7B75|nr:restriction endonuclease subunit S [Sporosarcina sp. Marseille-Q4063]QUW20928.1 restriction endonuclease subunit S [Sporosarcina sp. Marseille-Q4063]
MQPILRFPQFKGKWETERLNDLGSFRRNYSFSRSYEGKGNYKHLHYGDIHSKFAGILDDETPIPSITVLQSFEVIMNNDLIFADASEDYKDLGKSAVFWNFTLDNVVAGLHTHLFRPSKSVDGRFLMYFTQTSKYFTFIRRVGTGISVLGLSKTNLGLLEINMPEYEEQQKIADFFTLLDHRIEQQQEKVEAWREYKIGVMQKLFSQELRFKDEDGQEFPEWKKHHLSEITDRVVRKNKGLQSILPLTISAQHGLIDQEKYFEKTVASSNLEGYYLINKGEFAYNKSYSNGYPFGAIKRLNNYEQGVLSTLYICFQPNSDVVYGDYLEQYFETSKWHKEISMISVEGARNHGLLNIGVGDFFETLHLLPSLNEQVKISSILKTIDEKIELEFLRLELLQDQKSGFMQQMFI